MSVSERSTNIAIGRRTQRDTWNICSSTSRLGFSRSMKMTSGSMSTMRRIRFCMSRTTVTFDSRLRAGRLRARMRASRSDRRSECAMTDSLVDFSSGIDQWRVQRPCQRMSWSATPRVIVRARSRCTNIVRPAARSSCSVPVQSRLLRIRHGQCALCSCRARKNRADYSAGFPRSARCWHSSCNY